MADGFEVDPGKLMQHRGQIERSAARGDQVVDAGHQVTPGGWDNAYGVLFQSFPWETRPIANKLVSLAADVAKSLRDTASAIGDVANAYTTTDEQNAASFQQQADAPGPNVPQVGGRFPSPGGMTHG